MTVESGGGGPNANASEGPMAAETRQQQGAAQLRWQRGSHNGVTAAACGRLSRDLRHCCSAELWTWLLMVREDSSEQRPLLDAGRDYITHVAESRLRQLDRKGQQ